MSFHQSETDGFPVVINNWIRKIRIKSEKLGRNQPRRSPMLFSTALESQFTKQTLLFCSSTVRTAIPNKIANNNSTHFPKHKANTFPFAHRGNGLQYVWVHTMRFLWKLSTGRSAHDRHWGSAYERAQREKKREHASYTLCVRAIGIILSRCWQPIFPNGDKVSNGAASHMPWSSCWQDCVVCGITLPRQAVSATCNFSLSQRSLIPAQQ